MPSPKRKPRSSIETVASASGTKRSLTYATSGMADICSGGDRHQKHAAVLRGEFPAHPLLEHQTMETLTGRAKLEQPAPGIHRIAANGSEKLIVLERQRRAIIRGDPFL